MQPCDIEICSALEARKPVPTTSTPGSNTLTRTIGATLKKKSISNLRFLPIMTFVNILCCQFHVSIMTTSPVYRFQTLLDSRRRTSLITYGNTATNDGKTSRASCLTEYDESLVIDVALGWLRQYEWELWMPLYMLAKDRISQDVLNGLSRSLYALFDRIL